MVEFKKQHVVTAAYLKKWCDPETPVGQTPYLWVVSRDGKSKEKRAPKNIFRENDFYTVFDDQGNRNLELEHFLHKIEDDFFVARREIENQNPITDRDFRSLLHFIVSTYARTKISKREQTEIWSDLLEIYQGMEIQRNAPDLYKYIERLQAQPLPYFIFNLLDITVPVLLKMKLSILVTNREHCFITSDTPVLWIDPSIWLTNDPISFFGLESPMLEILFPISPEYLLSLTWNESEQYKFVDSHPEIVDEVNKMIAYLSDEYVVTNNSDPNPYWFDYD